MQKYNCLLCSTYHLPPFGSMTHEQSRPISDTQIKGILETILQMLYELLLRCVTDSFKQGAHMGPYRSTGWLLEQD